MQIMGDARDTLVSSSGSPPRRARLSSLAVAYRNPVPILSWARLEATVTKYSDAEWTTTAKILDGCGKLLVEGEGVWVARHDLGKAISIAERIASADTLAWDSDLMPLERISTKLPEIPRRVRNLMDATIAANVPPLHNPPSASQSSPLSSAVLHFGGLNPTVAPHEHHVDIYFITENLWGVDKITRGAWAALRWDETHNEGTDVSTTAVAHPPRIEFHGEYELGTGGFGAGDPATARLGRNGCVEMDLHAGFLFTLADTCYSNMLGTLYGEGPTGTFTCTFPHTHTVTAHPTGADFSRSGSGSWISLTSFLERQEKRKAFLGGRIMDAEGRDIVRGQGVWIVLNGQEGRAGVDNESGLSCGREYATVIRKGEVVQKHTVTESAKI
ncbi:hypothetical protein M427DRAFT_154241 [Gonapodya prolifera JEL478]|uniref:Uncharacterized protein n=1 Tax=Gonapodya prolifera (strain JEL478) TaxID=1344416 RepID=A0A139AJV3_GONPJ|nr:hypothetical protein M427DRAFT_154241 [Gonapodya prolifera JEL478]|eukprot:KXS16834.1 hypothetical protein M427DRAFT_154241 [Gonapodya prolifera JEL478]